MYSNWANCGLLGRERRCCAPGDIGVGGGVSDRVDEEVVPASAEEHGVFGCSADSDGGGGWMAKLIFYAEVDRECGGADEFAAQLFVEEVVEIDKFTSVFDPDCPTVRGLHECLEARPILVISGKVMRAVTATATRTLSRAPSRRPCFQRRSA